MDNLFDVEALFEALGGNDIKYRTVESRKNDEKEEEHMDRSHNTQICAHTVHENVNIESSQNAGEGQYGEEELGNKLEAEEEGDGKKALSSVKAVTQSHGCIELKTAGCIGHKNQEQELENNRGAIEGVL